LFQKFKKSENIYTYSSRFNNWSIQGRRFLNRQFFFYLARKIMVCLHRNYDTCKWPWCIHHISSQFSLEISKNIHIWSFLTMLQSTRSILSLVFTELNCFHKLRKTPENHKKSSLADRPRGGWVRQLNRKSYSLYPYKVYN